MADGLQDVGAMVTAGLAAREVERRRGGPGGDDHAGHPAICANCGTALTGGYCHACGQAGHVHKTAGAFFHDVAHGVFHFEGKVWRTLPMLLFRPGALTRRYIDGERVRFVSPMALFLFSVFLMFASLGLVAPHMDLASMGRNMGTLGTQLAAEHDEKRRIVAALQSRQAQARAKGDSAEDIAARGRRIVDAREEERSLAAARAAMGAPVKAGTATGHIDIGVPKLDEAVNHALQNPDLAFYKLKSAAYKYSWALIPLSLPFIWLLFPFDRRFGLYDHAIFATYSLSFMTLLVVAGSIVAWAGVPAGIVWKVLVLVPPIHIYRQMKGAYLLGRWNAVLRTGLLLFFTSFAIVLFGLLLLYLGLA